MIEKPRPRKTLFAVICVVAGLLLVASEVVGRPGATSTERWFWAAIGVLLIVLGLAELAGWGRREP